MKSVKGKCTAIISLALALVGLTLTPLQISADDSFKDGNQYFGDMKSDGNIFELTGVNALTLNDGVGVGSYKANASVVDSLAAEYKFDAKDVFGFVDVNDAQIILVNGASSNVEFLFTQGEMIQFQLKTNILGTWNSPDGSMSVKVGSIQYFVPVSGSTTSFQPLTVTYFYADYRSPSNEAPAAVAAVSGCLDTDTMQFTSVSNLCYQISGGWTLKDWGSASSNYGSSIYAGCDGHWTFLFGNRYHGAWVSIDNNGGVSHGGY